MLSVQPTVEGADRIPVNVQAFAEAVID